MKKVMAMILVLFLSNGVHGTQNTSVNSFQQNQIKLLAYQDEMLDFLLQIPFEKRQYIFPMLSEKKSIPKKIKTHPDVLVWKGKRPTRIAKRFQNDPELLEFLPAQFYNFLAPEMWPDEEISEKERNTNQILMNLIQSHTDDIQAPSVDSLIELKNSLKIVFDHLNEEQKKQLKSENPVYLTQLILFNSPQMEEQIKKQGFQSVRDFTKKADKIALIYRQYKRGVIPSKSEEQNLVENYISIIPSVFESSGFKSLLDTKRYSD